MLEMPDINNSILIESFIALPVLIWSGSGANNDRLYKLLIIHSGISIEHNLDL